MDVPSGVLLVAFGILLCKEATKLRESNVAPRDAFKSVLSALTRLEQSADFVSVRNSSYLIWPRGTYSSITYDGATCSYVTPVPARYSFRVSTYLFIKGKWELAEDPELPALAFQNALRRGDGTMLSVPASVRSALAESHIHRRFVCGIEISAPPESPPVR